MNEDTFTNSMQFAPILAKAVIAQVGGWVDFVEMAADVANHGADSGWSGFTYYADTIRFSQEYKSDLLRACRQMAGDMGIETSAELIAGFNCLEDFSAFEIEAALEDDNDDTDTIYNALAWFALEEVSRAYSDQVEG